MPVTASPAEPGVYVAPALLEQLERDKRSLKWQLLQATKAAEAREAQLAACETKVKDLMTIVEMNKSVADRAVKRNYTKECVLQRLHKERVQLQTYVETHQQRALSTMQRRRMTETKRATFQTWASEAEPRRLKRAAISRLMRIRRRRWIQEAWKRLASYPSAAVYPLAFQHSDKGEVPAKPLRPTVRFAVPASPSSSFLSDSSSTSSWTEQKPSNCVVDSHKNLSFSTWKAQWLARKRRHQTALHFARLLLAKRVLSAWKQVIRRRNWRDAMIHSALQRRRHRFFIVWRSWVRRRRRIRRVLAKLVSRAARRLLMQGFTRLRVKCLEKLLVDWTDVLKDARDAVDEERKIYELHQSEVMEELQLKTAQQVERRRLFVDAQLHALDKKRRMETLRQCMARWQRVVASRAMQMRVATQFRRFRGLRSLTRRVFHSWRHQARHQRAIKKHVCNFHRRATKSLLTRVLRAFLRETKVMAGQKRSLRRLCVKKSRFAKAQALWKWRAAVSVANEQATADFQQRELMNRLEIREVSWHSEMQRMCRVAYRYQLQCALSMGDAKRVDHVRRVWTAWKARVEICRQRKTALRRLLKKKAVRFVALSLSKWYEKSEQHADYVATVRELSLRRCKRTVREVFNEWRCVCQRRIVETTRQSLQYFALLLLRKRCDQQRARNAALRLMFKFHFRLHWQRPAFDKWHQMVEITRLFAIRQREKKQELLQRLWRRWSMRVAKRNRRKQLQYRQIAVQAEKQRASMTVKAVWVAWRTLVDQRRVATMSCSLLLGIRQRTAKSELIRRIWKAWTGGQTRETQRRQVLRRLVVRIQRSPIVQAWARWKAIVNGYRGFCEGGRGARRKLQHTLRQHHWTRYMRSILHTWRRQTRESKHQGLFLRRRIEQRRYTTIKLCFSQWKHDFGSRMRLRRGLLRLLVENKRKAVLRYGLRTWQRECVTQSLLNKVQRASSRQAKAQERAVAWLRKAWTSRDLHSCFVAWHTYSQNCQRQRQGIRRLYWLLTIRTTRPAWAKWSRITQLCRAVHRLEAIRQGGMACLAWQRLRDVVRHRKAQEDGLRYLLSVVAKALLRNTWTQWKRRDRTQLSVHLMNTQTSSSAVLEAFMERVGHRQFARVLVLRVFTRWKTQAQYQQTLRRRVVETLAKQDALGVWRCFHAWASYLATQNQLNTLLSRMVARQATGLQRDGFTKWKSFSLTKSYEVQLIQTKQQLQQHREALARHVAMTTFTSWQKATLSAVLRGWRSVVESKRQVIDQAISRCRIKQMRDAWRAWRSGINRKHKIQHALRKVLVKNQRCLVAEAWGAWLSWLWRVENVENALNRIMTGLRSRLLKAAWRSLREHTDVVVRRQSMMVVMSAQSQLKRQKDLHKLRTVTFALQHRDKKTVRQLFGEWKGYCQTRRQRQVMKASVTRYYRRRLARLVVREWRDVVKHRQRVVKWQQTVCRTRVMRQIWRCWFDYVSRKRSATLLLWELLETQRVDALLTAWRAWKSVTEHEARAQEAREAAKWRRASMAHQTHVSSLETKTELLLLESVELKRTMQSQRQRCMEAFLRRVGGIVDAVSTRKIQHGWRLWTEIVDRSRAARWIVKKLTVWKTREAFIRWKHDTQQHKWTLHETVVMAKIAAILSGSSVLLSKKTTWRQWRLYTTRRKQGRIMETLRRRMRDRVVKAKALSSWKTAMQELHRRRDHVGLLVRQQRLRLARQTLLSWWRWLEHVKAQREGVLMLLRIDRAMSRRCVMRFWLKWRTSTADSTIVMAKTKVVLMELEEMERATKNSGETKMMRVFTAWREAARQRTCLTDAVVLQLQSQQTKELCRRVLRAWRTAIATQAADQKRTCQPVICIRSPFHTGLKIPTTKARPPPLPRLCSFADFTKQRQGVSRWRVQLSKRVAQRRMRRLLGVVWLVRCLKRHQQRQLRRAFWRWFAKIQEISSALHVVDFGFSLPWRRQDVDHASSMLLLVLEEMDLARQIHQNEKTIAAWRVVNAIAESQQRHALRRGFDKWRWGGHTTKRVLQRTGRVSAGYTAPSTACSALTVKARACVAHLARVLLLRGFAAWKAHYIRLALQQAQAEQNALLQALAQTTAYHQAIDAHCHDLLSD